MIKVWMMRPKALTDQKAASHVYAHGGGGVIFSAEDWNKPMAVTCLDLNCVLFNVDFRNGPETRCPWNQQDFVDAFLHIHANATKYGLDSSKITIGGESGGGWVCVGAANLMVKSGDISKVNSMIIFTGMVSDEGSKVPDSELMRGESRIIVDGLTACFKLLAADFDKQTKDCDDQLYPGTCSDQIMKQYPPTVVFTAEFDYLRRANEKFARRLKSNGKLVDINVIPGCGHAMMGSDENSQEYKWVKEDLRNVFNACVRR